MTKKVRLYNTERGKWFIIPCPDGHVVLSCEFEGVHYIRKPEDDFSFLSDGVKLLIQDVIDKSPSEEYELKDAVRIFGSRLDSNWSQLKGTLKKCGLDLKEYNTNRDENSRL